MHLHTPLSFFALITGAKTPAHVPTIPPSTTPPSKQRKRRKQQTHTLNNLTNGSQVIITPPPGCPGLSELHLYCTSSLSAQRVRSTGGLRARPLGSVFRLDSRSLRGRRGVGGDIGRGLKEKAGVRLMGKRVVVVRSDGWKWSEEIG